ncbi:MAG: YIP1 family protein [Elusimicrobiota bacterium]
MLDIFLNIITSPGETIYRLSRKKLNYSGFIVLAVGILSTVAGVTLLFNFGTQISDYLLTWGVFLRTITFVVLILFIVALYHFFAGVFGGQGSPGKLFKAIPYSMAPFVYVAPMALIIKAFFPGGRFFFLIPVLLVFLVISLYYQYKILNYFYGLSFRNAVAAFILPWFIILGTVTILPLLVIASLGSFFI